MFAVGWRVAAGVRWQRRQAAAVVGGGGVAGLRDKTRGRVIDGVWGRKQNRFPATEMMKNRQ